MNNDYELLYLAKENNEEAISLLYKKYYNTIYRKAAFYSRRVNKPVEDFINEGTLSFYNAIANYIDKNSFKTYLNICLNSSLSNYAKSLYRQKNKLLDESILLEEDIVDKVSLSKTENNPEYKLINEIEYNILKKKIIDNLSWKEELILELRLQNFTTKEISEITDNNLKTVYNIIKRIQNKVVKLMS